MPIVKFELPPDAMDMLNKIAYDNRMTKEQALTEALTMFLQKKKEDKRE